MTNQHERVNRPLNYVPFEMECSLKCWLWSVITSTWISQSWYSLLKYKKLSKYIYLLLLFILIFNVCIYWHIDDMEKKVFVCIFFAYFLYLLISETQNPIGRLMFRPSMVVSSQVGMNRLPSAVALVVFFYTWSIHGWGFYSYSAPIQINGWYW